jgi:aminoglycoside 3-N-acetyltransferase
MTIRLRELLLGFRQLRLANAPVIIHASLSALGDVEAGAGTVVNALAATFTTMMMPTFTYKTMIIPRTGPGNNGITYGANQDLNAMAEFFTLKMPADRMMGTIPETMRRYPRASRSNHPILSFAGINADKFLQTQTIDSPLEPIAQFEKAGGWVLLMGVDQTVNTSIHQAEKLAGRKQFIRWALTPKGVVECPAFPGCSAGFQDAAADLEKYTRKIQVGNAAIQAIPLGMLFRVVIGRIHKDPLAMLCRQPDCERCNEIRKLY